MSFTLAELAEKTGTIVSGDSGTVIESVADIDKGVPGSIVFVSNAKYARHLETTDAAAVIVTEDLLQKCNKPALVSASPRLAFSKIALLLNPIEQIEAGISPDAVVAEDAAVDPSARIEACAVIKSGATVGAGSCISACSVIEKNASIGAGTMLYPNVTIGEGCTVGNDCILHAGAVIGADGFGYVWDDEADAYMKVPQLGNVRIGNDVEIGSNTSIDRGAIGDTVIEDGVKIDNQTQIGHNDHIGRNTTISGSSGIAGSVVIGENCVLGGGVAIGDNLESADKVYLTGRTNVANTIKEPGWYSSAIPAIEARKWRRIYARIKNLDELAMRVKALEKKLEKQEKESE